MKETVMTGEELKQLRESWGLTQVELAETLGYTPHQIQNLENGRSKFSKYFEKHIVIEWQLREIRKIVEKHDCPLTN